MAYTYDPIFAADPNNPAMVASNAAILIYNPADPGKAPVTITDSSGSPLSNPITVNKNGFGPAFQHATLDRLAWQGGGFEGYFTSYEGMKNAALAAQTAAETAAGTAGASAAAAVTAVVGASATAATTAATSATTAAAAAATSATAATNAANLVGAPADAAIVAAVNGNGETGRALKAAFAPSGVAQTVGASLPNFSKTLRDYNDANPETIRVITLGSSVMYGAEVGVNTLAARLNTKLQENYNQSGMKTITVTNGGVNGSVIASGNATDYELAKTAAGGVPKLVVMAYGMNDLGPAQYHSGQTFPGVYTGLRTLIAKIQREGADVIIMTTPHPNPINYPWSYGGGVTYPKNSGGTGVVVPAMTRAASNIVGDWAGTGVANVEANYRALRVNQAMRQAAQDAGAAVIDAEKYWFEAVAKHGVSALFNGAEYVHPNLLGHQESYWRGMDDFFRDVNRSKIQGSVIAGNSGPVEFRTIGEKNIGMSNGQVYTLNLPENTVGELTLYGTAGGGWQGSATCRVTTRTNRAGVSALVKANASTSADIIASIAASTTLPQVTVTTATTGTGGAFTWVYRYFIHV